MAGAGNREAASYKSVRKLLGACFRVRVCVRARGFFYGINIPTSGWFQACIYSSPMECLGCVAATDL